MAATAQQLINNATALGYDRLSERDLKECILAAAQSGGGGGGAGQIVAYTIAPPANPTNVLAAAIAYDPNGILPLLGWNTNSQSWA